MLSGPCLDALVDCTAAVLITCDKPSQIVIFIGLCNVSAYLYVLDHFCQISLFEGQFR